MSGIQSLSAIASRPTSVIIADQIRERIIDGSFQSGEQINEAQVATQLNVSRGPVREALNRLVQEGLLVSRPNRGNFVRETTEHDIAEVYEAREVIECAAAESIIRQGAETLRRTGQELREFIPLMQEAIAAEDWTRLSRVDIEFHTHLVRAGGNTRLDRAYATLATEALICMTHLEQAYPDIDKVVPGHTRIIELLEAGDMEAVHLELHSHLTLDRHEHHTHEPDEVLRHGRND
ncbi:MAG TPA: GntR family transcriptional regulator [Candidatus Agrococcus pullicola]|uniref:GntR family transcriptional regulator n=1 Tax=Candidatus Agrococcus pullicola TaxID=2838429 RepID=A0A9D2C8Y9_9MICO|nr:GntR family transcriptional regulator [Candidatus Agrococcus pullicola]